MAWQERLAQEARAIGVVVESVEPLHGGACQENFRLRCAGGADLVLRSDAKSSLPGSLDRATEAKIIALAADRGVPTPGPRLVLPNLIRPGATAIVMDFVPGVAIGAKVTRDPKLAAARGVLTGQLAYALASIHRIQPEDAPDLRPNNPQDGLDSDAVTAALGFCRTMMELLEPRPAMERVLGWLERNRPDPGPLVLVHGDYRVGNFLVGPEGLNAVLDWEFSHWGSAGEDLAWISVRDWRFGKLDKPVGGLAKRADFHTAYRNAGGVVLQPSALRWFEVLGNLRWATGAMFQALRVMSGAEGDLELLAIGRRATEMEWEALRQMAVLVDPTSSPAPVAPSSRDSPDKGKLLDGVASFLVGQVLPAIEDRGLAFRVRIAAHLVATVSREVASEAAAERAELEALVALGLAEPTEEREQIGPNILAGLAALADRLKAGEVPDGTDAFLTESLAARLSVSNPKFSLDRETGEDSWDS